MSESKISLGIFREQKKKKMEKHDLSEALLTNAVVTYATNLLNFTTVHRVVCVQP